jgi:putative ATP-dependent endonuclease of OLD family
MIITRGGIKIRNDGRKRLMDIILQNIRIKNFRSLQDIDLELNQTNILIGQNNVGKSNLMRAIDIAFNGSRTISEDDIYVENGEHLSKDKTAIIDMKICPMFNNAKTNQFSDFWTGVFTDKWIVTDEINGNYVGIRTVIEFDIKRNDYIITRKPIKEWNDSIETAKVGKKQSFTSDMSDYMNHFYMDAHRDVTEDIRDRKSYFGRATSKVDLDDDKINELESKLNAVNQEIIGSISAIEDTKNSIARIGNTLGGSESVVQIEPLSRKISDLHKGMDITYKDGEAATFSVAQHGMGTRSWISFLTLGAYVNYFYKNVKADNEEADDYVLLSLEEPEAHLHPQAQKQIYKQLLEFRGQKIVSTHSTSVLAQAELKDIIQFKKKKGKTYVCKFDVENYDDLELQKIKREVIRTQGELIFSNAIILCEGITEEQELPIYFKEFFGIDPTFLGVNIIGIGGQNYSTYLKFIKEFNIDWYIFSDGEKEAIKTVKNAIKSVMDEDYTKLRNVFIIENGYDIEKMTIKSGNMHAIIDAINLVDDNPNSYDNYVKKLNGNRKMHREKTDKPPCPTCGQFIYEEVGDSNENGLDEKETQLYRCMTSKDGKAKYAAMIATQITKNDDIKKRFPDKILQLLFQIEKDYSLTRREIYNGIESIGETTTNS